MSQRREKKIRRLERRVAELEGEKQMLCALLGYTPDFSRNHWLYRPYYGQSIVGPDGQLNIKPDIASSMDYINNPLDADYTPIPSGHKPGFFRRLWKKLFG